MMPSRQIATPRTNADRFVIVSGCSGGGKSTLLDELALRGFAVVEEPGRRIVREEVQRDGLALPWIDPIAFARRAVKMALADRAAVDVGDDVVFFDRGLIDAASALQCLTGEQVLMSLGQVHRYHRRVFLAPPWPEIFSPDAEHRHSVEAAQAEYARLCVDYPALGYDLIILPKAAVTERADFVLEVLSN